MNVVHAQEIIMSGESITIVEETLYVEKKLPVVVDATLVMRTPLIFDLDGNQTWMC